MQRVDNITTFFTHYFDQKVARVATLPLPDTQKRFYAEFPPHRIVIAVFLIMLCLDTSVHA